MMPIRDDEGARPHAIGQVAPAVMDNGGRVPDDESKIKITLPRNAYFMSGIRDFTLQMVMNMTGFSEQWAFRFQSVVDELCNNAIEHGSGDGAEINVTFISKRGRSIEIKVEDTQTGPVKRTADGMRRILEDKLQENHLLSASIRGRGLAQIVYPWTDELRFENGKDGGLVVWAKKNLK